MNARDTRSGTGRDTRGVIVRPYPKVILLYPTALCALVCGLVQAFAGGGENALARERMLGLAMGATAGFNMLVLAFEFTRLKSFAIGLGALAALFLCLWLGERWPVIEILREFLVARDLRLSTELYFGIALYFALILVGVMVYARFNYYEIKRNLIVHHTGFLGHVKRFPSPNLRMTKEINDIFEYGLLRLGRIILFPATEKEAIVLENIINVNTVERDIHEMLKALAVEIKG